MTHNDELKAFVQAEYGQAALQAKQGRSSACCGIGTAVQPGQLDPITANLYEGEETAMVPEAAVRASLRCGNATALATINPGETVLDLGSGGGIDVLLSARGEADVFARGVEALMKFESWSLARRKAGSSFSSNAAVQRSIRARIVVSRGSWGRIPAVMVAISFQ